MGPGHRVEEGEPLNLHLTCKKGLCLTFGAISKCVCYERSCVLQKSNVEVPNSPGLQNVTVFGDKVFKEAIRLK